MAYEYLKKLWGTPAEGEAPKALTVDEFITALEADKTISVVDLKAGGYVSQDKYNREKTRADSLTEQLNEANTKLGSFEKDGVTLETVQKEVTSWKEKYAADTKALNDRLAAQEREHLIDQYLNGTEFTSKLARKGIKDLLSAEKSLTVKDGSLVGADDLMNGYRKDYADAFKAKEQKETPPASESQIPPAYPFFTPAQPSGGASPKRGMTLQEAMIYKNQHPDANVAQLLRADAK